MGGVLHHAEALRLLAAIEGVRLTARERLELGLLPGDDDARGIDSLHAAALTGLGLPDSHEAVAFGIRCISALGELCRELECSERLGLIGGHQTVLRLMTEGQISGDARRVAQPLRSGKSESEVETECSPAGRCAPTAVGNSNSVASGHPPPALDEEQEGEENEVQSAAALVAANAVSSGSTFPMLALFPAGEGSSGLGRFPLQYDFVISDYHTVNCAKNRVRSATAVSAAATTPVGSGSTTNSIRAARGGSLDGQSFSILVRAVKERQHSQFDVGFVMWPAAVILSRLLCRHPELVRGRRVLEIGAGLGLAGLVAARLQQKPAKLAEPANHGSADSRGGAASVTLSDFNPLILRALEANVALNAGRASVDAAEEAAGTGSGRGRREGSSADGFRHQKGNACDKDRGTPDGQPTVCVRHLDWDKLEDMPSVEGARPDSPGDGGDPPQASGSSLERPCRNGDGECNGGLEGDCDSDSDSGQLSDGGSTSRQQQEGGGGGVKGIEHGERFDLIIASDHICQASDAEGTVRVLQALLAEATPPLITTTTTTTTKLPTLNPSPAGSPTSPPSGSPDGSGRYPATPSAQQQQQQHLCGGGEGYSRVGGGHAHFVVAHPRTRWGVDALVPLLLESPGLSFTCEEVSDPDLVAGLEEASYLAWLHVHVWRREAAPAPATAAATAGDSFDRGGGREVAAGATDEVLLVVG